MSVFVEARTVNPLQYGLKEASNGYERYDALLRCHRDAQKYGYNISYKGIDTIKIEIPWQFLSIPLTNKVDFSGVTIITDNKTKDCALFELKSEVIPITVSGFDIDRGYYKNYEELKSGKYLLIIEDTEPWCIRRRSGDKVFRKDVVVVKNGIADNHPIMTYGTSSSNPVAYYRRIDRKKKIIKNLNFVRSDSSTHKVFCLKVYNQYNIELRNITITTPDNTALYGDAAIHFDNCALVTLNDIRINGTYSQVDKFGYGVGMVNIYGLKVNRMYSRCNWGVFGTQSLNEVLLKDCDINRFDIHCYGRDVRAENCRFTRLYNQISSVYGKVSFRNCFFQDFTPLLIESSYNAYTPFDLEFKDCVFYLDDKHNFILTLFGVPEPYNDRPELRRKCLPNISMEDCTVYLPDSLNKWMLVKTGGVYYKESFDYISEIGIKNIKTVGNSSTAFDLFSEDVKTSVNVKVRMQ